MKLLLWFTLAQGADIGTTAVALNRGCVERVLLPSHPTLGLTLKGGAAVTVTVALGRARVQTKAAKAVLIAGAVSGTVGAVLNTRTLPRCSP